MIHKWSHPNAKAFSVLFIGKAGQRALYIKHQLISAGGASLKRRWNTAIEGGVRDHVGFYLFSASLSLRGKSDTEAQ
jgi:hypothetical protein